MKTERKMLISIALIFIMLLNCMMPIFSVYATTDDNAIVLNSKLYSAIKTELLEQAVEFEYDDDSRTITISPEVIATITRLDLNNYGIFDLTGLENFTSVNHIELSGNSLTKDSNLAAIANLPLNHLDLSTNKLEDISEIDELVDKITAEQGIVILSNQSVTITEIVETAKEGTYTFELPKILEKAGYIKSDWIKEYSNYPYAPCVKDRHYTGNIIKDFVVDISESGLVKYVIHIHDDETQSGAAANLNKADTNILKESKFVFNVVVHTADETGIYIPDSNLYKEIKKQLTAGMDVFGNINKNGNTENTEIASYPYKVDYDGNIVYDECTYEVGYDGKIILYVEGEEKYLLDPLNNSINNFDTNTFYTKTFEKTTIAIEDPSDGTMTYKTGYKVALNGENETLYNKAYDEQQVFVIDNTVLMNKITSLKLNNKQIRDLTGIEWFVGLKSSLDVSQNYLSNIEPIFNLQGNKNIYEEKLRTKYNYVLSSRPKNEGGNLNEYMTATIAAMTAAEGNKDAILNATNLAILAIAEAGKISSTKQGENGATVENPDYTKSLMAAKEAVNKLLEVIYDHTNIKEDGTPEKVKGLNTMLEENLEKASSNLKNVYKVLKDLYEIYSNEYKLLTMLTDNLNYMDFAEYVAYTDKVETESGTKALISEQITKLVTMESSQMFSDLEEALLEKAFGVEDFDAEEREVTLAKVFADYQEATGTVNVEWLPIFRKIALISEMSNYCLIRRMNDETTTNETCYCEEYLKARIKEFKEDDIDVSLEEEMLYYIEKIDLYLIASGQRYDGSVDMIDAQAFFNEVKKDELIYEFFRNYSETNSYRRASDVKYLETCEGIYEEVTKLEHENVTYTDVDDILKLPIIKAIFDAVVEVEGVSTDAYPDALTNITQVVNGLRYDPTKEINFYEYIDENYQSEENNLYLYNEVITLAKRLVGSNTQRYVYLPKLKELDISNNADLTDLDRLGELTSLRVLNAGSNYIGDISNVDWNAITYLRKLNLSHNFITDITPLQELVYLKDLNVSKNLLSGAFEFDFFASQDWLRNLDLSYNQLEDITDILIYLDIKTKGDYANYLSREDTLNINLANQEIEIVVDKTTFLPEKPTTVNVDLPKIFTQLLAIDTERTTFGLTSLDGRIESEGKFVTLDTRTIGDKTGTVSVIAEDGYNSCVGLGTTATIKYKVEDRTVSNVVVTPETSEMAAGETQTLVATVNGENLEDTSVTWSVEGAVSADTAIDENGVLTLGADETAETITVKATSNFDNTKSGTATVTIVVREVTTFEIDKTEAKIIRGEEDSFTVTIDGINLREEDKEIIWQVTPNATSSENTVAETNANVLTLKVAEDEPATTVIITATSKYDDTKVVTATVTIESREVTNVTINPTQGRKEVGTETQFTATVEGNNLREEDKAIVWLVEGNLSADTIIDENGLLKIAADETAETLKVKVTSVFDEEKFAEATIEVYKREVTEVTLASVQNIPEKGIETGTTLELRATVVGTDLEEADEEIIWSVSGNRSTGTKVENGLLTVAADETATAITVTATSAFDETKSDSIVINLYSRKVNSVTITPNENVTILKGEEKQFTATVNGENLEDADRTVTWSIVTPNVDSETTIDATGKLTVATDEENRELIIKAVSNFDNTKEATVKVTLEAYQPQIGLGYKVDNEAMLNVETNMPVDAFKEKVAKDYKVVVKTDGQNKQEVTDGIIKTGMWVYIYDKNDTKLESPLRDQNGDLLVYQIVVKGDVNGDGVADGLDTNKIKAHINEVEMLSGVQLKAADINSDGEIDIRDTKLLLYHIAEVKGYMFDYVPAVK